MSYFVLPRPEGTYATKPTIWDSIMPGVQGFANSMGQVSTDQIYKQAAKKEGLVPNYAKNADGSWSIGYRKPDTDMKDILFALAGIKPMESVLSPDEIQKNAPLTAGPKMLEGGGEVGVPDGSTFDNGAIRNAAGEMIGEYAPGYEPKKSTEALRSKMNGALMSSEIGRKALGLSTSKGKSYSQEVTEDYDADLQAAIAAVSQTPDKKKEIKRRLIEAYPQKSTNIENAFLSYGG